MLEVSQLAVNYRGVTALENISFTLNPGQLLGVIGPNGAGKSTMLKAMLGLVPAVSGLIRFGQERLDLHLRQIAYVPQRSQIDWDYPATVWDVVMMARTIHTGWFCSHSRRSREVVAAALQRVGIWDLRQRQIGQLSGGQQQRVFLARSLAQEAELFFFDEPFSSVDGATEEVIFDVFAELKARKKTLVVVSHDLGDTLERYDRLLLLSQRQIAFGEVSEVVTSENLRRAYGETRNRHVFLAREGLLSC
jgi:manganese/iron transport system ATP-binding protein